MDGTTLLVDRHVHHWRIEEPYGQTSKGYCLDCAAERVFQNTHVDKHLDMSNGVSKLHVVRRTEHRRAEHARSENSGN